MRPTSYFTAISAMVLFVAALQGANAPVIGVAMSSGNLSINSSHTAGNANLYDGSTIETGEAPGRLALTGGQQIQFASETKGRIFHDRLLLERGTTQLMASRAFSVEANTLKISGLEANTNTRVALVGAVVEVQAVSGVVRVANQSGNVIANLTAGKALAFTPQQEAGASAPTVMVGTLTAKDGKYYLTDETTNVTVEVQSPEAVKHVNRRVRVTGAMLPGQQIVLASKIEDLENRKTGGAILLSEGHPVAGVLVAAAVATVAIIIPLLGEGGPLPAPAISPTTNR